MSTEGEGAPPAAPAADADIPPNQTLYVNNLNEKIRKDELKRALYHLFSQFGNVLEIVAAKTYKLRGQAWIVFEDLGAATRAHKQMKGFLFYEKPMRVAFAKAKSDVVAKLEGTYKPRPKRKAEEKDSRPKHLQNKKLKPAPRPSTSMDIDQKEGGTPMELEDSAPANKILFVQNIHPDCTKAMLRTLFSRHAGFKEVRLVGNKKGIAFVEFEDKFSAGKAMEPLQGFKLTPENALQISYAKQG